MTKFNTKKRYFSVKIETIGICNIAKNPDTDSTRKKCQITVKRRINTNVTIPRNIEKREREIKRQVQEEELTNLRTSRKPETTINRTIITWTRRQK